MAKFSFSKLFSNASKDAQAFAREAEARTEDVIDAAQKMAAEAQKDAAVIAKKVERSATKTVKTVKTFKTSSLKNNKFYNYF
jgi:regulator of protease activity HflC (stomatin/prohibitin superfamily)